MKKIMLLSTLIFGLVTSSFSAADLETCTAMLAQIRALTIFILPALGRELPPVEPRPEELQPSLGRPLCRYLKESANQFNAVCPEFASKFRPLLGGYEDVCPDLEHKCDFKISYDLCKIL